MQMGEAKPAVRLGRKAEGLRSIVETARLQPDIHTISRKEIWILEKYCLGQR